MTPTFVISVPVGAYHPLLRECLYSLDVQSPRPRVALMDASGDVRVATLADEFEDLLVYRRHGPDAGQSDAILEGWANVDGEILGWLNADDALYPDALAAAADLFAGSNPPDVVAGHSIIVNDRSAIAGYHWAVEPPSETLLRGNTISQPSCFFTRDLHDRVGGIDVDLHYTMDWDLWVRFWRAGAKFEFIHDVLSRVLWTSDAKTGGLNRKRRKEIGRILDANATMSARIKSRIGFTQNFLFEYVLPKRAANVLRRSVAPSGSAINGLGRDGQFAGLFRLVVVNYRHADAVRVHAAFLSGAAALRHISINGETATWTREGEGLFVDLPQPLSSADSAIIQFETESQAQAVFAGLELQYA